MTTQNFKGEKFKKQPIQDLSDYSCKTKCEYFFDKAGCSNIIMDETQRTGEDLICNGSEALPLLKSILGNAFGDWLWLFELTTRTHRTFFDSFTWGRNDDYNVMERRVRTHYGDVKDYTALIEPPWCGKRDMESFVGDLIKPNEWSMNGGRGPSILELDPKRLQKVIDLLQGDKDQWIAEGCPMVIVLFENILSEFNKQLGNGNTTHDPNSTKQSFVTRMPSSMRIRIRNFELVNIS